jgi:hypothetical protein
MREHTATTTGGCGVSTRACAGLVAQGVQGDQMARDAGVDKSAVAVELA